MNIENSYRRVQTVRPSGPRKVRGHAFWKSIFFGSAEYRHIAGHRYRAIKDLKTMSK